MVDSMLEGCHATIMSYGASGSGKSYTLEGCKQKAGMLPLALEHIFDHIEQASYTSWSVRVSCMLIRNGSSLLDLLPADGVDTTGWSSAGLKVKQAEDYRGCSTTEVAQLSEHEVGTKEECFALLEAAREKRQKLDRVERLVCRYSSTGY
jgi:hypothetical protein